MDATSHISQASPQQFSHGEAIILGFTGSIGSGCSFISNGLKEYLPDGRYFRLSSFLYEILKKKENLNPTTKDLQEEGNRQRKEFGNSYLTHLCMNEIKKSSEEKAFTDDTIILIDGIRNDGEIRAFRAFPNFYLISIHADENIRKNRLVGKNKRFLNENEFKIADRRDKEEDFEYGQKVRKCNYLADIIINNDNKHLAKTAKKNLFFQNVITNYIDMIKALRRGEEIIDHPPSINEILMTAAYGMSKRTSCEKRKVGAVLAYVQKYEKFESQEKRPEDHIKFQIVSSGYNEVPLGTSPCKLGNNEKCYRDHLKEEIVKKLHNCPNCGTAIPENIRENHKLLVEYFCANQNCKMEILKEYLPGESDKTGKLLDMCRALHAEEIAILGLQGISKISLANNCKEHLVLYTTTYPCNLCANKIVAAGITKVVYAEPYTMEDARKILASADIDVIKFEGVKSTAFFRLYS